jgi:hypothetical protein
MRQARRLVRGDAVDDAPADADPTDPPDDRAEGSETAAMASSSVSRSVSFKTIAK